MYKCDRCGTVSHEDDLTLVETSYEAYYGVHTGSHTLMRFTVCPECDCPELSEWDEDDEE